MKLKNIVMALCLLAVAAISFAMPPREGIKEPAWVIDARKAGMDSPKDGLIQQLRAKDATAKISGSREYPVVIGYFTDTASTYTRDTIQLRLFNTGPNVMSGHVLQCHELFRQRSLLGQQRAYIGIFWEWQ